MKPKTPTKTGWIFWALTLAAVLGLNAVLIFHSPARKQQEGMSSHNPAPGGAKALYLLLKESGHRVSRKETSMKVRPPRGSILLSLNPESRFSSDEMPEIRDWLKSGGVLFIVSAEQVAISPFGMTPAPASAKREDSTQKFRPPEPDKKNERPRLPLVASSLLPMTRGTVKLSPRPAFTISESKTGTVFHLDAGAGAVLAERRVGKGSLFVYTCPETLENKNLVKADNLRLFLNVLNAAGPSREIIFDEYRHGRRAAEWTGRAGLISLMFTTPYGLCALLLALGGVFWLLNRDTVAVRGLRPHITKASSLDHIAAVAALHSRLNAHQFAAARLLHTLHRELLTRLALPPDTPLPQALEAHAARNSGADPAALRAVTDMHHTLTLGKTPGAKETLGLARAAEQIRRELRK